MSAGQSAAIVPNMEQSANMPTILRPQVSSARLRRSQMCKWFLQTLQTPQQAKQTNHESKCSLLELQLMHHYTYSTSQMDFMANHDPGIKDIYIRLAPILALKHECLMNALLASAALHMFKLDPERTEFADAHRRYFDAAVVDQRQAVTRINPDNADALCLAASFISLQALSVRPGARGYSPPSVWLDLAAGNATLFQSAWKWLVESNQILAIANAEPNLQQFNKKCWEEYPDIFPPHLELESIFPTLLEFRDPTEDPDTGRTSVYRWAMGYIGLVLQRIESGDNPSKVRRLLLAFGAMVPPIFKTLVRERQSRALVILAYYFAIMKAVDDVWWIRGVPEREVFGIQSLLPERWQWATAWPIQKLSFYCRCWNTTSRSSGSQSGRLSSPSNAQRPTICALRAYEH